MKGLLRSGLFFLLIVLFTSSPRIYAKDLPDWVRNYGKSSRYPELIYLTGFGMAGESAGVDAAGCRELALQAARSDLIRKIRVDIQASLKTMEQERDQAYSASVVSISESRSALRIEGLESLSYKDEGKQTCYALAHARREKLIASYLGRIRTLLADVNRLKTEGDRHKTTEKLEEALDAYLACTPLLRQVEELQTLIAAISSSTDLLKDEAAPTSAADLAVEIKGKVSALIARPVKTPADAAWQLAVMLYKQKAIVANLKVVPLTYERTGMASPFSHYFRELLEQKMAKLAKWRPPAVKTGVDSAIHPESGTILAGSYWKRDANLLLIAGVRDVKTGQLVAGAEVSCPLAAIEAEKQNIRPQNFEQALKDQDIFSSGEITDGGMALDVWTTKGREHLTFTRGERLQIFIRVNQAAYIRFVYHLADGQRVLLLDNYYIASSQINKLFKLPYDFECDAPFGAEVLQAFASSSKFEPAITRHEGDYDIITEELKQFVQKTRGLKRVKKDDLLAERRLIVTTMEDK